MANLNTNRPEASDPRPEPNSEAPTVDSGGELRTAVAGRENNAGLWLVGGGAALLGVLAFLWLSSHRTHAPSDLGAAGLANGSSAAIAPPPPAPAELASMEAASRGVSPTLPPPPMPPPPAPMSLPPPLPAPVAAPPAARSPVLVVDLAEPDTAASPAATPGAPGAAGAAHADKDGTPGATSPGGLNGDEQFAARVEGSEPDHARATVLHNRSEVVAQGATIPGVLETALNSDLPGFARAVVSRDVRSFDGSSVLIPRGSRVIGEYRSAAALGQSRAFVIWTRVLRPDGVSIQIGSPVTDPLGRAGVAGSVDRHFLERFGGAILLSVIDAGVTKLAGTPSTEVVIGSSQDATSLASSASAFAPLNISPTIKVPQGTPIRIFVARDLDFSSVEGHDE